MKVIKKNEKRVGVFKRIWTFFRGLIIFKDVAKDDKIVFSGKNYEREIDSLHQMYPVVTDGGLYHDIVTNLNKKVPISYIAKAFQIETDGLRISLPTSKEFNRRFVASTYTSCNTASIQVEPVSISIVNENRVGRFRMQKMDYSRPHVIASYKVITEDVMNTSVQGRFEVYTSADNLVEISQSIETSPIIPVLVGDMDCVYKLVFTISLSMNSDTLNSSWAMETIFQCLRDVFTFPAVLYTSRYTESGGVQVALAYRGEFPETLNALICMSKKKQRIEELQYSNAEDDVIISGTNEYSSYVIADSTNSTLEMNNIVKSILNEELVKRECMSSNNTSAIEVPVVV